MCILILTLKYRQDVRLALAMCYIVLYIDDDSSYVRDRNDTVGEFVLGENRTRMTRIGRIFAAIC